jgi:transcriptional regulator with XRE-family HTH domain
MITGEQVKFARKLLGWSQMALALEAGASQRTVMRFERGESRAKGLTISAIRRALEAAGVEFMDDMRPGGRMKSVPTKPTIGEEAAIGTTRRAAGNAMSARRSRPAPRSAR